MDLRLVDRQPKRRGKLQAVPFILDTIGKIDSVRKAADLLFENMRGRRGVRWLPLLPLVQEQRGLFLCAGHGDPKVFLAAEAQRRLRQPL